jgi:hypothetical protein
MLLQIQTANATHFSGFMPAKAGIHALLIKGE